MNSDLEHFQPATAVSVTELQEMRHQSYSSGELFANPVDDNDKSPEQKNRNRFSFGMKTKAKKNSADLSKSNVTTELLEGSNMRTDTGCSLDSMIAEMHLDIQAHNDEASISTMPKTEKQTIDNNVDKNSTSSHKDNDNDNHNDNENADKECIGNSSKLTFDEDILKLQNEMAVLNDSKMSNPNLSQSTNLMEIPADCSMEFVEGPATRTQSECETAFEMAENLRPRYHMFLSFKFNQI